MDLDITFLHRGDRRRSGRGKYACFPCNLSCLIIWSVCSDARSEKPGGGAGGEWCRGSGRGPPDNEELTSRELILQICQPGSFNDLSLGPGCAGTFTWSVYLC